MNGRYRNPLGVFLALLLVTLSLAACGGGGSSANESVDTLLAQTFGPHQSVHSGQLSLSADISLQGLKRFTAPISFKLSGPFQGHSGKSLPDFNLALGVGTGAQNFSAGITSTANKAFINFAGTDYAVPDSLFNSFKNSYLKSASDAAKKNANTFSQFGINPGQWLAGARKIGKEQVGGASTEHITSGVDVPRFLADISKLLGKAGQLGVSGVANAPTSISPAAQAALAASVKSASVDLYTGSSDHVLRRLKLAVVLAVPQQSRQAVAGLSSGTIGFDLLLSGLGGAQTIKAPANAQPLANLTGAGGAGATTTTPAAPQSNAPQSTTPQSAPGVAAPQAYLDCVTRARGDVATIQRCSPLLNGAGK